MITIGDKIKEIRKRYGLSQERFAEELNTYRIRIGRIENGTVDPTFQEIVDICNKYNTDIEFFVTTKMLSSQDFEKISKRYICNNQLSFDERRETLENLYICLAQNNLTELYDKNVINNNKYLKYGTKRNEIDIETIKIK